MRKEPFLCAINLVYRYRMKNHYISLFFLFTIILFACSKGASPEARYAFFVAGHAYGNPNNSVQGLHPPFLDAFDFLNAKNADMGFLTGDVVRISDSVSWELTFSQLGALNAAIHIAPGNHDIKNEQLYTKYVGERYYSFKKGDDLFLVLDGNLDSWNIEGEQLAFVEQELSTKLNAKSNVFVFVHQLIWWKEGTDCPPNSLENKANALHFDTQLMPVLKEYPNDFYLFAGDVGAISGQPSVCYEKREHVHLIASGMGIESKDNVLLVTVNANATVGIELIGLNCTEGYACLGDLVDY